MKKKLGIVVTALALIVVMMATLCACGSTWGKIKRAYTSEGYHELQLSDELKETLHISDEDTKDVKVTIHVLSTAELPKEPSATDYLKLLTAKTVVIAEYKDMKELKKYAEENYTEEQKKDLDKAWEEFQKLDNVNGNCVLIGVADSIWKGAK